MAMPVYRFNASLAFPELPSKAQSTGKYERPAAALSLAMAYLLSGNKFGGSLSHLTPKQIWDEVAGACAEIGTSPEYLFAWAESLLKTPESTLTPSEYALAVPRRMEGLGFLLHEYQRQVAAYAAARMGSVLALGCGTGKSAISTAAAIAVGRLGKISTERCVIISPLNAMPQWEDYIDDLRTVYSNVAIISCDSLHHYTSLSYGEGGALIIDEIHKLKNHEALRTGLAHEVRTRFQWGIGLTGTLLHTGCEGIMSIMDLACPGLARFLDKWDFGEEFDAIARKKVPGRGYKRSLIIPPEHTRDKFQRYLSRGVRSLSFASPEVSAEVQLPGQTKTLLDTWAIPEWIRALRKEFIADMKARFPDMEEQLIEAQSPYLWGPETDWRVYLGALAMAIKNEQEEQLIAEYNDRFDATFSYPEDVETCGDVVVEELRNDRENQVLKDLAKLYGLPGFPKVFAAVRRDGNVDRIIERVKLPHPTDPNGPATVTFKFRYAPGTSVANPAPGVKVLWAERWLKENPDEQLVVGAASSLSVAMMAQMMEANGISYHLIEGGVVNTKRKKFVREFQKGETRVMLVQQVAGSESITLTKAATTMLLDHDLSPIPYTQYLARTCRQGQKRECEHYDFTFNAIQTERILALQRGEEFDADTRAAIEAAIVYDAA